MEFFWANGVDPNQSTKSAQNQWSLINAAMGKFARIWSQLKPPSGTNVVDQELAAQEAYRSLVSSNGKDFEFKECWNFFRKFSRWDDRRDSNNLDSLDLNHERNGQDGLHEVPAGECERGESSRQGSRIARPVRPEGVKKAKLDLQNGKLNQKIYEELKLANQLAIERKNDFKMSLAFTYFSVPEQDILEGAKTLFAFSKKQLLDDLSKTSTGAAFFGQPTGDSAANDETIQPRRPNQDYGEGSQAQTSQEPEADFDISEPDSDIPEYELVPDLNE